MWCSIYPGKRDCVSIKFKDGSKDKAQKRLLPANLNEIYAVFKSKCPDLSVVFSTFVLHPKWCIPIGVSGSHSVCMFVYACTTRM